MFSAGAAGCSCSRLSLTGCFPAEPASVSPELRKSKFDSFESSIFEDSSHTPFFS